jgi:multidrug efflux pump subunit AcrB
MNLAVLGATGSVGASTLDVVRHVREVIPATLARLPKDLKVALMFDQSLFVRASIQGVLREALIAAGLTALMLLVFLGSWRSTVIVLVTFAFTTLVEEPGTAVALVVIILVSIVADLVWKRAQRGHTTTEPAVAA